MQDLWKAHPIAFSGFLAAAAVTLIFIARITTSALYGANHRDESVKPWMTVGYIAKSWHLDPARIDLLTGLPGPKDHGPWTLAQIARARGVEVAAIIKQVNDTIAALEQQKEQP